MTPSETKWSAAADNKIDFVYRATIEFPLEGILSFEDGLRGESRAVVVVPWQDGEFEWVQQFEGTFDESSGPWCTGLMGV